MPRETRVEFQPATEEQVQELRSLSQKYIELAKLQQESGYQLTDEEKSRRIGLQDGITLAFVSHEAGTSINYSDYLEFKISLQKLIHELKVSKELSSK
jgi:hypothetical protein